MKIKSYVVALSFFFVVSSLLTSTVSAEDGHKDIAKVEEVIHNFYSSLNHQDSDLYLKSIANSGEEEYKYLANNLEKTTISYEIINIQKVNDQKFIAEVSKTENGLLYPVIPYDIILENGHWKLDSSNIVIYPTSFLSKISESLKDELLKKAYSENKNFIIVKDSNSLKAGGNQILNTTALSSTLSYPYRTPSTHIYFSGSLRVDSSPGPNPHPGSTSSWVEVILNAVQPGGNGPVASQSLSADRFASASFTAYGYHYVEVYNFNYPSEQTGTYSVVW